MRLIKIRGYRSLCIRQQESLAIDSDTLSEPESEDTTMGELMPVSDEVIKDFEATTTASFYSVRSTADDDFVLSTAFDDSVLSTAYGVSLLSTADNISVLSTPDDELPPPSIGQKEIRWSSQVLAQLLAVPRNDEDIVFKRLQRMSEATGEDKAEAWIRSMDHPSLSDSTPPTTPDDSH